MEVRLYRNGDEKRILPAIRDVFNYHARLHGEPADCTLEDARGILRAWLKVAYYHLLYVLEKGGNLIGFARVRLEQDLYYLEDFGVTEEQRQQGYGSTLLQAVEADLRRRGAAALHAPTYAGNLPGLDFLLKNGYAYLHTIELQKVFGPVEERAEVELFGRRLKLL
ncbi:MAG: GNAT family N-acetyltransferase [Chloroflexi bacterium]|nr:GNAT family N-acetyltransferase [Chloroflexota bacterium]